MRYVCLEYMDVQAWRALTVCERRAFRAECQAYDDLLAESGHVIAREMIDCEENAATLKLRRGGADVNPGCLPAAARPPLRGIVVIEAIDMNHAIRLLTSHPAIRRGAVVEIRPASPLPRADAV
jgi:hypothetical protein